jgi:hypothetical protein
MPQIKAPALQTIYGGAKESINIVSFAWNFTGDTVSQYSVGGVSGYGSTAKLAVASLNNIPAAQSLKAFRALVFSCSFENSGANTDGSLTVSIPSTGQTMRFAPLFSTDADASVQVICACVPIVSASPTEVWFTKTTENGVSTGALFGLLTASIMDFELPSFVTQGAMSDTE